MALKKRNYKNKTVIHHSDTGLQYCSNEYQKILDKQGFNIDKYDISINVKRKLVQNAIEIYNNYRFHSSNYMLTPKKLHKRNKSKENYITRKKAMIKNHYL
tara:strand:+ start:315 stop:617 length:303 start_codon:yes stop_codon:yes gene_type:complete